MALTILYIVSTLDALSFVMTLTTVFTHVNALGGSQLYMGVLGSVAALISLVWSPIIGSLSDNIGPKKALLQCLFVCLVGNLMAACTQSLFIFFVGRTLTAFGTQIATLLKSMIDDKMASKDEKMASINRMQAIFGFCFIFGSLASGFLSEFASGTYLIFALVTAMFGVNFGLIAMTEDAHKRTESGSFRIGAEMKKAGRKLININWKKFGQLFAIKLIIDFVLSVYNFQFALLLTGRYGLSAKSFGYVFTLMSIISIITSLRMTKIKEMFYAKDDSGLKRLLHVTVILIGTLLALSFNPSLVTFLALTVPLTVARLFFDTTFTEVLLTRASPQEKGSVLGTFDSTVSLAGLVAPVLAGIVGEIWGQDTCFLLSTLPLFACLLLIVKPGYKQD